MRNQFTKWLTLVFVTSSLLACAPGMGSLKSRRGDISKIKKSLKAAKEAQAAGARYKAGLKGGGGPWLAISKGAILKAMKSYLPYRFKGPHMSKRFKRGQLWFSDPSHVVIHPNNRMTYRMKFGGKGITVSLKGVFGAGKSDERKIKEALEGGGILEMETTARINRKTGELFLFGTCNSVHLRRHNSKRNQKHLRKSINGKFFKYGVRVAFPEALKALKPRLLTTANHFVVVGQK